MAAKRFSVADLLEQRRLQGKKTPLEVILEAMDNYVETKQTTAAVGMAIQAAPYVHAKLRDRESGEEDGASTPEDKAKRVLKAIEEMDSNTEGQEQQEEEDVPAD